MKVFADQPVSPLTATLRYDGNVLRDDGCRNMRGDGSGAINYKTGEVFFIPVDKPPEEVSAQE